MRSTSRILYTVIFILPLLFIPVRAETQVFQDAAFPYRVSCLTDWTQGIKNDSIFQLQTTLVGKKTRFEIKKSLDTGSTREIMGWSRVNFAFNREFADMLGTVISSDTGINRKIGNLRAFELCALFMKETYDSVSGIKDTVWWGDISRWTEYLGHGYRVTVISDTADIINNRVAYKAMLDSVSITAGTTAHIPQLRSNKQFILPGAILQNGPLHDLLGRKYTRPGLNGTQLQVQRQRKRPIAFEPGGR